MRMGIGWRRCPSSRRRFHIHWLRICQTRFSAGCMGTPTVGILLFVLIAENRLEGSSMQVEGHDIGRGKRALR